jgi:hypothetical protein
MNKDADEERSIGVETKWKKRVRKKKIQVGDEDVEKKIKAKENKKRRCGFRTGE